MTFELTKTKYKINITSKFKKDYRKISKQGKDINKLITVLEKLANGKKLDQVYKDHALMNDRLYKNCRECHIEPDWLLVYKLNNNKLVLLLIATGSHSDLF